MENRKKISPIYNISLFCFFCVNLLTTTLFDPNFDARVPWDSLYESYPNLSILAALLIGVVILLWGATLFKKFWNRLVSDIWGVRELEFQESLAIVLVIAIVGS